jgi:Flp pilus assembly protein TadB
LAVRPERRQDATAGRDANQRWLAYFIPGIVLVVVATPVNGLARVLITAVAIVFLLMAVIVGGRQRGT